MDKVIEFYDDDGKLFPTTIASAVRINNSPLDRFLENISNNNVIKKTTEAGLYITDEAGHVISKYTENGFDSVLSESIRNEIKNIVEYVPATIEYDKNNKISSYKRLTDGGVVTSPIIEKTVYIKDVVAGNNTVVISDQDNYIQDDYFKCSFSCPGITITGIVFSDHQISISFTSTTAYDYVNAVVEYSGLTLDNYDVISISVSSPSLTTESRVVPTFAKFKYNKKLALSITSDDQGVTELENGFAYFNGYPTPSSIVYPPPHRGEDFLISTDDSTYQNPLIGIHNPLTFTDDIGGVRRFSLTSAVFGYNSSTTNYTQLYGDDAKMMRRFRWSFAHHDGSQASDLDALIKEFKTNSEAWEKYLGVGLKIMVEPNGNHDYLFATRESPELCMAVFQNSTSEYRSFSLNVDDWTQGKDITSFRTKPKGGFIRTFFQSNESNFFENILADGEGKIVMGGTHGLGSTALGYLKDIADNRDDIWISSIDEIWEYYHNYNNSKIINIRYLNGSMSFDLIVPKYSKHQFAGELTINIPLTDVTACTLSSNNTIGGYRQNAEYFTINTGIETQIYDDISRLITVYKNSNSKATVKRDAQYLIDLLVDGTLKDVYQNVLDNS